MLQKDNLQREYAETDFRRIRNQSNLNLVNLSDLTSKFMTSIPNEIKKLSIMTDKLSNLIVIAGNTYFYNKGKNLKVIENSNIDFDPELNSIKLKPSLAYKLEPKEGTNKLITDKKIRIFNKEKSKLTALDDMLIRKSTINIRTEENNYKYTIAITFNELTQYNNINLKLNEETESYPHITEIYYINNKREKKNVKILNNNLYDLDIDLVKNSSNIYSIDTEVVSADNIYIVLEDNLNELIIDSLDINYMEYPPTGYITFEAIQNDKPIMKVGIESEGDIEAAKFELSYNNEDWIPIDVSNTYALEKKNKVISYNTISTKSIKTEKDVKLVYIKVTLSAITEVFTPIAKINKNIHVSSSFNNSTLSYNSYSLYENSTSNFYGKLSNQNRFDFKNLYNKGEYLIIDNQYYVKGFIETDISKTKDSKYVYAPVSLKTKEYKVTGDVIEYKNIDISTKEIYSTFIEDVEKNLIDTTNMKFVLPLEDTVPNTTYYVSQGDKEIEIDLSIGYINSVLDVLFVIDPDSKLDVYLLDSFKNPLYKIPSFTLQSGIKVVSLLDTNLFKSMENLSYTYPLEPLKQYELGLLDNKIESINKDRDIKSYNLVTKKIYTKDMISHKNTNYAEVLSSEDYQQSFTKHEENIIKYKKQQKLLKSGIVKGSVIIEEVL